MGKEKHEMCLLACRLLEFAASASFAARQAHFIDDEGGKLHLGDKRYFPQVLESLKPVTFQAVWTLFLLEL